MSHAVELELDPILAEPEIVTPEQDVAPPLAPLSERIATLVGVMLPFIGLVAAIALTWGWGFTWLEFTLLLTFYLAAGGSRDVPLVMGLNLFIAVVVLAANILTDLAYGFVDPRIRYD